MSLSIPWAAGIVKEDRDTKALARELFYDWLAEQYAVRQQKVPSPIRTAIRRRYTPKHRKLWTRERCILAVREFIRLHGRTPTQEEWRAARTYNLPGYAALTRHCTNRATAVREARRLRRKKR